MRMGLVVQSEGEVGKYYLAILEKGLWRSWEGDDTQVLSWLMGQIQG